MMNLFLKLILLFGAITSSYLAVYLQVFDDVQFRQWIYDSIIDQIMGYSTDVGTVTMEFSNTIRILKDIMFILPAVFSGFYLVLKKFRVKANIFYVFIVFCIGQMLLIGEFTAFELFQIENDAESHICYLGIWMLSSMIIVKLLIDGRLFGKTEKTSNSDPCTSAKNGT